MAADQAVLHSVALRSVDSEVQVRTGADSYRR